MRFPVSYAADPASWQKMVCRVTFLSLVVLLSTFASSSFVAPPAYAVRVNNLHNCPIAKTPVEKACLDGDLTKVKSLLRNPANLNNSNTCRSKLIIFALMSDNADVVQYLIERGASVNERDCTTGLYPLHLAIFGHEDMVRCLLDHGADVNASAGAFGTALNMAVEGGSFDVAAMLLMRQANTETKEFVTVCGEDGRAVGRKKCTPLFAAAASGQIDLVRLLVRYHADVNYVEEFLPPVRDANGYPIGPVMSSPRGSLNGGKTSLDAALENGHAAVASFLESVGAKRNQSR